MIKSFEGLRGVAALGVALLHLELAARQTQSPSNAYLWTAYLLVDLFFVLSGFVIGRAYEKKLINASHLGNFLVRRTGRLYPLFIFSTVAYIALDNLTQMTKAALIHLGFAGYFHKTATFDFLLPSTGELLAAATLTHSLGFYDQGLILNYPSWSISTEYYTYLVFGICVVFLTARNRILMYTLLIVASTAVAVAGSFGHDCLAKAECLYLTTDLGIFRCLAEFLLGVVAARWAQEPGFLAAAGSRFIQTASLAAVCVILVFSRQVPWLAFFAPLAFFILILSVALDSGWVARLFGHRLPAYLGKISYSVYLMHAPMLLIFGFVIRAAKGPGQVFLATSAFVVTVIVVSHLTFLYIEAPFRVRANAFADRLFLK